MVIRALRFWPQCSPLPLVSLLFAFLVVFLRVNQVIAGLAIVFFCYGLTGLLGTLGGWTNRAITGLHAVAIWPLSEIPIVGKILFSQDLVVYLAIPIFFLVNYVLTRSMLGLRLRSVGENPQAADAAGVSVSLYRLGAVIAGSALIGLAGGYLSVVDVKLWIPDISGGRGWIAVALVIFARWQPWRALFGAHTVRQHRGADSAHCGRWDSIAAIFPADDAVPRDHRGHGLGGGRRNSDAQTSRPRSGSLTFAKSGADAMKSLRSCPVASNMLHLDIISVIMDIDHGS